MSAIPITVTGTVATEPAARTLPSGRACASFRLAVNHWRVDKDTGEFVTDGTSWFSVDCYGDLASNSSMSLHSGTAVIVTGTLKIRQWETEERSGIAPTVVAEHIGPDLRYGTANYRRSKAPERAQNQAGPAARETDSPQSSGWDALSDTSADGGQSASGDGAGAAESTGSGESAAAAESAADTEQTAKERDAAIAQDTAEAAAPF
ncbi:single-stranded DNA-binding protein [Brevibacterium sp. SMBL_HHYL_HB1]|uniref:single-stranded DNA-binding protein n=1 Tax=Brevibacterium sp. SMBL_HHYL_HB1 TaxID=2777556 RepID=UPI001BA49189|nr:single-stranded DNA-binding protein [Brevibacterium sp. SMBL_HHYL_HB1]QUL80691.1 single-stranded DNA-binding protein [Brevibacterium sp. SMBL_HHYL_HB1]